MRRCGNERPVIRSAQTVNPAGLDAQTTCYSMRPDGFGRPGGLALTGQGGVRLEIIKPSGLVLSRCYTRGITSRAHYVGSIWSVRVSPPRLRSPAPATAFGLLPT